MSKDYVWSAPVAASIEALPAFGGASFWSLLEQQSVAPEVLAYLVRVGSAAGDVRSAERVFAFIWDRAASYVLHWAQAFSSRLERARTAEDVLVEVFTTLWRRLIRSGSDEVTFYECCFLRGLKQLTQDVTFRLPAEDSVSLTTELPEDGQEEQQDLPDPDAVDPLEHLEAQERRSALRAALPDHLFGLPEKVQRTAFLLMANHGEGEIARMLGVSTRMVTNYKATIRQALTGLEHR